MTQIDELAEAGCDGVLVATALHRGSIDAAALARRIQSSASDVR